MLRLPSFASISVLLAILFAIAGTAFTQTSPEARSFYSGTVVENAPDRITVARNIQGRNPEQRTFIINSSTTIEGTLKQDCRVTVRFAAAEEGDVALSIIVRGRPKTR